VSHARAENDQSDFMSASGHSFSQRNDLPFGTADAERS
jgi:hypothetical protein